MTQPPWDSNRDPEQNPNQDPHQDPSGAPTQPGYGQQQPAYGQSYPPQPGGYGEPGYGYATQSHGGATTSMWLGIGGLASLLLTPLCCVTLPGMLAAPFAWWLGAKTKRQIDAEPGRFGNRGMAQAGFVLGIVGTVLGILAIAGIIVLIVALSNDLSNDFDWTGPNYDNV